MPISIRQSGVPVLYTHYLLPEARHQWGNLGVHFRQEKLCLVRIGTDLLQEYMIK